MGYGEFDGGGSVEWEVDNGDPDFASAKPNGKGANGKDKKPKKGDGGRMAVWVNGVKLADVDCDTCRVVVAWGDNANNDIPDKTNSGRAKLASSA